MRVLLIFARAYPWQTLLMLLALLLAGVVDGISISALLPLFSLALRKDAAATAAEPEVGSRFEATITAVLNAAGISPTIGVLVAVIVVAIVLKNLLILGAECQVGYAGAQVAMELRLRLLRAMLATRWEYFVRQPIGRLANAMTNEPTRSSYTFVHGVTIISLLIQTGIYTGVALLVSWYATLAILCAGCLILLAGNSLVSMTRRAGRRRTRLLKSLSARLADTLQSVKPLKAMAREDLADTVLATDATKLTTALRKSILSKAALRAAHEPMFTLVLGVGIFAALVLWHVPLATILILALVLFRILDSLGRVQKIYQKMVADESAYWSLCRTIEEAEHSAEQSVGGQHITLTEGIRLTNVHLAYGEQPVLTDLSLDVPAGTFTTLIGLSGAGKTTIVDLVTGLLHPQAGEVTIDDTPLAQIDLRQWRRQIGYVPQDNLLLHDTILMNITLGDPTLRHRDAADALRAAGVWEFVEHLPAGLATIVGERGMRLSGGQRQRIMIARALVHRPKLLILDEATTSLDPQTEASICATLQQLVGDMTILAVSHQAALLDVADRVYRIQHGTAVSVVDSSTAPL